MGFLSFLIWAIAIQQLVSQYRIVYIQQLVSQRYEIAPTALDMRALDQLQQLLAVAKDENLSNEAFIEVYFNSINTSATQRNEICTVLKYVKQAVHKKQNVITDWTINNCFFAAIWRCSWESWSDHQPINLMVPFIDRNLTSMLHSNVENCKGS